MKIIKSNYAIKAWKSEYLEQYFCVSPWFTGLFKCSVHTKQLVAAIFVAATNLAVFATCLM